MKSKKTAIIIGAGPAGLTAAYELLKKTNIKPIIFEKSLEIGGISKTINYKGNRIDIGGHRFFSKSKKVMDWWQEILPLQGAPSKDDIILNRKILLSKEKHAPDPEKEDKVMLVRTRLSRIFFLRSFFNYPIALTWETLKNLGIIKTIQISLSYLKTKLLPTKKENSLEDFLINRFGKSLYLLFFKSYTEKVWGLPCTKINPDWGAQRIKGLSITTAIIHALKRFFSQDQSINQKKTETSLIEKFTYPKLGPGQLWEEVAEKIIEKGGEIFLNHDVVSIDLQNDTIQTVYVKNKSNDKIITYNGDYFFSTMPIQTLINSINNIIPQNVKRIANGLKYRDFITVGVLLKKMKLKNTSKIPTINDLVPDNWIYIQEKDVHIGRLQIFNNWSPYMVKDPNTVWLGLEYFCNEGDKLWKMSDKSFAEFGINELINIDMINKSDVLDSVVIRTPKAYPAYFGTYNEFDVLKQFIDSIKNLFLIGRNGMHRYNNADHSMLTAMTAVDNIINNITSKNNIWEVNTEKEYHEKKSN